MPPSTRGPLNDAASRSASVLAVAGVVQRLEPQPSKLMMPVRFRSPARQQPRHDRRRGGTPMSTPT